MSFILDALKKSENKRRKRSAQLPRSIHEPVAYRMTRPRTWTLWVLLLLVVNAALMIWLVVPWLKSETETTGLSAAKNFATRQTMTARAGDIGVIPPEKESDAVVDDRAISASPPMEDDLPRGVELPVPRTEKRVFMLDQLPSSVRQQIPELHMPLHAYNRNRNGTSMVQLNNRIYREGDSIGNAMTLETITAEGAIIRFDGYRFLLPRRGQ